MPSLPALTTARRRAAAVALTLAAVAAGALTAVASRGAPAPPVVRVVATPRDGGATHTGGASTGTAAPTAPASAPAPPATPAAPATSALQPLPMPGCPPPPSTPPPYVPPWHPDVLVPDAALPAPAPPAGPAAALGPLDGKGMWVWSYAKTEGGDAGAVVARARAVGLHSLWVRVADSRDGFYGAAELAALVPAAHRAGIAVVAWGFPYLYDPVADAGWSAAVLGWRSASGDGVDGFSADIETSSEGVALSAQRVAVYLGLVRAVRDDRPLVATVYPPTDHWMAVYPYAAMAPYIDAFAPMLYWECRDPGAVAAEASARLGSMRPVHIIGQAFGMGDVGGRRDAPGADELDRFMTVGRGGGAIGASFWVWQSMDAAEWAALAAYVWPPPPSPPPGPR